MKKQHHNIDGFIPRRLGSQLGELHDAQKQRSVAVGAPNRLLKSTGSVTNQATLGSTKGQSVGRSDIDESLREIDSAEEPKKKISRKQQRLMKKLAKKPRKKMRLIKKLILITIILAAVSFVGFVAYKFIGAGGNMLQGNLMNIFQSQPLKQDSNGRSNFLILGTTEDDPNHPGSNLTDSMLVVSVDQNNKNIYMFSIPRDLYVEYGEACVAGYYGKINSYFSCSDEGTDTEAEQNRLAKTQKLVGDIFGLDIQYGVHINQTVLQQAVDAVGGIDVDIQGSNGESGILDRNFDWRCNYTCYLVKYDNGVHHLDGYHALYLAQARGDVAPTYGLGNSNFDREKNQQKIIIALKEKATSTGTLTNLSAVTKLIEALGDNLRTNIQTDEIRTIMQVVSDAKSSDVHTLSLNSEDDSMVTSGSYGGASVVMPAAGVYDYSAIQAFIKKNLNSDPVVQEAAPVVVLNGSGVSGLGQSKADILIDAGFTVPLVNNAPDGEYDTVTIYQIGDGNTATAAKLTKMYDVIISKEKPPVTVNGNVRFVVVFGPGASVD